MHNQLSWRVTTSTWLALFGLGLALWLTVSYSSLLLQIGTILFGAFLLSLPIRPLVDRLGRWRIPRGLTVLAVYALLFGLLTLMGTLLVPVVSAEIDLIRANGPNLVQQALVQLQTVPLFGHVFASLTEFTQNLTQYGGTFFPAVFNTVTSAGEMSLTLLVVLVLAYFFVVDATIGGRLVHMLAPPNYQVQIQTVLTRLHVRLIRWVWAQLAVAFYFGLFFGLGLVLLGVPFAPTIALVGGIIEIIPYIGGAIALMLAVLSALTVEPWLALWVIGLYTLVVQIQSHIIVPNFYGKAVDLHPAAVLVALLIGAKIGGLTGVFFSVPVTVVLLTLLQEIRQQTERHPPEIPD